MPAILSAQLVNLVSLFLLSEPAITTFWYACMTPLIHWCGCQHTPACAASLTSLYQLSELAITNFWYAYIASNIDVPLPVGRTCHDYLLVCIHEPFDPLAWMHVDVNTPLLVLVCAASSIDYPLPVVRTCHHIHWHRYVCVDLCMSTHPSVCGVVYAASIALMSLFLL